MKNRVIIVTLALLGLFAGAAHAQQARIPAAEVKVPDTVRRKAVPVVLGLSDRTGGYISRQLFDSLLRQGVKTREPGGKVTGFRFNYKERNIYEDSAGNIMIVADLLTEVCPGDTLTPGVSHSIYQRIKKGDTAYFDNIRVHIPGKIETPGKSMQFVID